MATLRPSRSDDAPAIAALLAREIASGFAHFGTEPPRPGALSMEIAGGLPWQVAVAGGALAGFARVSPWKARGGYAWTGEVGVYVAPEHQGRGLGKALVAAVVDGAREQGFRTLLAGIALPNPGSVALFETLGFRACGTLPAVGFKQGAWRDVGYWALHLGEGAPGRSAVPGAPAHLLHHASVGVTDLQRSTGFYDAVLAPLGFVRVWSVAHAAGYGPPGGQDHLALFLRAGPVAAGSGFHLALPAPDAEAVRAAHAAALDAGGTCDGPPGPRPAYGPTYYAGFLRDPDGHKLELVCNGVRPRAG